MQAVSTRSRTPAAVTGKQKLALSLRKAGYSYRQIAEAMDLRHQETAYQLVARATVATRQLRQSMEELLEL